MVRGRYGDGQGKQMFKSYIGRIEVVIEDDQGNWLGEIDDYVITYSGAGDEYRVDEDILEEIYHRSIDANWVIRNYGEEKTKPLNGIIKLLGEKAIKIGKVEYDHKYTSEENGIYDITASDDAEHSYELGTTVVTVVVDRDIVEFTKEGLEKFMANAGLSYQWEDGFLVTTVEGRNIHFRNRESSGSLRIYSAFTAELANMSKYVEYMHDAQEQIPGFKLSCNSDRVLFNYDFIHFNKPVTGQELYNHLCRMDSIITAAIDPEVDTMGFWVMNQKEQEKTALQLFEDLEESEVQKV